MSEYRLTEAGRIGLRMLLNADRLLRADRRGLHLLGMEDVVDLPDDWTEPVPPPLPPEPHVGAFVACGGDWNLLPFFRRWSEGWSVVSRDPQFSDVDSWAGVVAVARERAKRDPVLLVPVPEPVELPERIHDVVAFAIARAEKEPCASGHYVLAEHVVGELRVRGWLSAADEAEREQ